MISESLKELLKDDVFAAAPAEEPQRQHYFIEQLKKVFSGSDRRYTAAVVTFGCQMNARDSEKLEGILSEIGFATGADEQDADFVAFNTCTVRENANEHLYGRLGRLKSAKIKNRDMIISVCGCMMQEADEIEKLRSRYSFVDIIFGTHNLYTFPELLFRLLRKRSGSVDAFDKYGRKIGMYKILPDGQIDIVDNNGNVTYSYKVRRGSKTFMYDKNGNVSGSYEFRKDGTCKFYDINEKYTGYFREELH